MISVLIDGYSLSDGSERRGIGTLVRHLVAGLDADDDVSVRVLADAPAARPAGAEAWPLRRWAPRRLRPLEHDLRLPFELGRRRDDIDVFHSPAQHPPRHSPVPWVQTLHDLIPLTRPHPLLHADRRRWLRVGPRVRAAAAVAAVSRFSAQEGIRHLGLDPHTVEVIHPGVDRAVFHPHAPAETGAPYVLHVAAWGPHKGFAEALEVIARLAERGLPHRLKLVGPQDGWMRSQVQREVNASPRPDRAQMAGYVEDLAACYRGAAVLLVTSRCEGFGLPALEAMACGTPVVAFTNSSLPEVLGDGGALVADGDTVAMAATAELLINDAAAREDAVGRGLRQAAGFVWADCVKSYAELFRSVAG